MAVGRVNVSGGNYEEVFAVINKSIDSYGGNIGAILVVDDYLYFCANGPSVETIHKFNNDTMEKIGQTTVDLSPVYSIESSGEYIYAIGSGVRKIYKNTLESVGYTQLTGGTCSVIHNGYLYAGGYKYARKYDLETLEKVAEFELSHNGNIQSMTAIGEHIFISDHNGSGGVRKLFKLNADTLSEVDSIESGSTISNLIELDGYIYCSQGKKLQQYNPSDLELVKERILSVRIDYLAFCNGYFYVGDSSSTGYFVTKVDFNTFEEILQSIHTGPISSMRAYGDTVYVGKSSDNAIWKMATLYRKKR